MSILTGLIPSLYSAVDIVSRELVGFIPAVQRDASVERAALNQLVTIPIVPQGALEDIVPAMVPPGTGAQTIGNVQLSITKSKAYPILWTGEEEKGLNTGVGFNPILRDQFIQGLRTFANAIEADLAALHINASRAYGTPGSLPFATDLSAPAQAKKILDDNGAPQFGRSMIINTTNGASMRSLAQLTNVNQAGTSQTLRQGALLNLDGFEIGESAQVQTAIPGTGAGATTDAAGYAVGSTVIGLASAGTGTLLKGDVVTFAGDTNQYVLASGDADTSNGGSITIAAPGLRVAMSAAAKAITVKAAAVRNMFFTRNALVLAARAPALPIINGKPQDMALDRTQIVDPVSGLVFELSAYLAYRQVRYELAMAWGTGCPKPEHLGLLLS